MARNLLTTCLMLVTTWAAVASGARTTHESPAPAPSSKTTDCSSIIYNMADCVPFLSKGDKDMKPVSSCCTGFKSVLKVNADCICEALKSSASLGIDLNMTKAVSLPSACGVSAPPISKCGIPSPPSGAPVKPPSPPKTPPAVPAPALSEPSGQAPAPAPSAHSGSYSTCASFKVIIMSAVVAFFFCIV